MGAQRRFQRLPSMLPARVDFPSPPEGADALQTLDATVVDISRGGVCMRIAMDDTAYRVMEQVSEGLFVQATVVPSELRQYTVLGRVAWIWVPSMEDDDDVGSIGVDIKGVAEEDGTWLGKMRLLFSLEDEVDVDRSSRLIRTRTARLAAVEDGEEPSGSDSEPEEEADETAEAETKADGAETADDESEAEATDEADEDADADADEDAEEGDSEEPPETDGEAKKD